MLLFASLSLNVSAASDNLVNPDLKQWDNLDAGHVPTIYSNNKIYRVGCSGGDSLADGSKYFFGLIYDLPSFIAGHSYTLKFKLPSAAEIASAWNVTFSDTLLKGYYNNAEVSVGYGFVNAEGTAIISNVDLFTFNSSNISRYVGTTLSTTFVAGSSSGRPCLYIEVFNSDGTVHFFYFSDFVLYDNDDNSKELTGIKGFLHSIRWDLVGGVCEEEDCPHSSEDNPHLSLTERMSSGFATMFENIASNFEEGSTLNTWFNNLSSGVSDLGDREEGFFSDLGDRVSDFFDKLKQDMSSGFTDVGEWFSGLGEDLSNWFDGVKQKFQDVGDSIKLKFQEVGDSIKQKFQDIADKFTEFFEKFKPRVSINLEWMRGVINAQGVVVERPNQHDYQYVIISEALVIPSGNNYKLDYIDSPETQLIVIFKYDAAGNFLEMKAFDKNYEGFVLEGGYQYRFRSCYTPGVEDLSVMNDYVIVYADEGWINALLLNLKNGIRSLFVPDEEAILQLKSDLDSELQNHLGIIYTSTTLIGDFIETVFNMVFNAPDDYSLMVPEVTLELSGENYTLWEDTYIDFSFMETEIFQILYGLYTVSLYIFFGFLEVKYALRVYRRMMSN